MARPRKNQVEDAAKLADELIAAQAQLKTGNPDEPAPDDDTLSVDDSDEPAGDDDLEGSTGYDLSGLDDEPPVAPDDTDLAHKFSVLQGKYKTETERLSSLLSSTMTEVQNLKAQLASRPSTIPEIADLSDDNVAVDSLKEQFPTLHKSFMALARIEASKEITKAVKGTTEKVDAIVLQGAEDKKNLYYARLSELIPSWEQINNHPAFLKWLGETDEFSGTTRKNLISASYGRNDYVTTAKFFNAFIKEKGIKIKGKLSADTDDIAPDTSGASVNRNVRLQAGEISRAQIAKFFQDKAQGKLVGTEAEIAKMEAKFFQAVREGKVRK